MCFLQLSAILDDSLLTGHQVKEFKRYPGFHGDSPGSPFADPSLVVSLFVVQFIVGSVFAFGGSCDHGP